MAAENTLSTARQRRPHLARDVAGFAVPLLTFVALLLITFIITRNLADQASINAQLRFLNDTDRGLAEIKARVRTYEDLLRNTQSLFLANPKLTRQQWQQYVNSLQVQQRYPGLASLGFVAYVPQNQQTAFLESTRADGAPNFAIHSSGTNPDLMVLKYVMALPKNDAVLGWDLGADPAQRTAAEAARDTGQTIISPKLTLPQDTGGQSAFIMLVPVYTSDGSTSAGGQNLAVADPRGNLVGWIYGGIHPDVAFQDLMSGSSSDLSFEVFDGKTTDQASLLWDSDIQRAAKGTTPEKTDRQLLTVGGRDWTVGINSLPAFDALLANAQNPTLLIVGGIASLLAAIALYALMNTQRNAITLADRMTAALRESEERFRLITENAADLIAVVDRNNRRLYNSPSYQTILGYTPDELRRTSALEQVHPDDRDRVNQLAAESLKTGVGRTIEYRMKHKDGGYRVLESIATVIRDERGQPENFVIVARDVTERKAQEALLRRQNEYLSALQQTTLGLVSHLSLKDLLANLINRATDLVSVKHGNIALTTADGSELETLVGVGVYSKRIGAKVKPGRDLSGQVWQTGQPMTVEDYQKMPGRIASADLDTLHAMASFPLKTGNRVVGVISVARERVGETFSKNELDVLDQIAQLASIALDNARLYDELEFAVRERTAELQTSEARYRTIIENIEDGYYELNLTGDLVYFNDALVRISGYTREELRGLNYRQYTAPETADRLYQALRHVYSSGEPVRNVEFDIWKGETRTASVGLSVSLIRDREGTATGFRGILRDMTEERRAALLQNATLRISQQALTAPTLDEFYKGVHAIVGEIVPAKNFYIAYFDPAGQTLNFPYFVDEKDQLISQADRVVRIGRGLTAYALRGGKPLRLTGAEIDELQTKGEVDPIGSKPVEWMGIPLVRGEEPFGVVVVQSYDPKVRFSDFARDLLAALARPLADTIDRKQAEEALVASEERNRLLVQSSPDPIVIYDTAGQVTDLNAAFVDTFGWTRAEVVGKTVDFVPPENKGETDVAMRDLHEHGRNVMLDTRRKTKDGRTLDVQLSASLLRGRDGLPIGNIVVLRDVTVRRRAEEAIRQQANYLGALQDTTVGLVSRLDVNSLLRDIVERAGHLVETENGYVYLVEPGGDEMELRVGTGLYDDIVGARTRPGVGLAGLVWQSSQPLVLDDYQKWPQRLAGARRDLLRAVVGVPLKSGEQTVGVIGLAYTEPDRKFGDNEMDVLSRFAQLAAVALDNVRLYQETQHSVTELRTLNNISQVLASQRDLNEMCKQVVEELTHSFEASSGYVALYNAATRTIEIPYLLDRHQPQPVEPIPLGEGLTSLVITSRQPLLINTDTAERARELGARLAGEPPLSFLAVPILSGSDVIGVVSVQTAEEERLLTRDDENLLTTVAANLSVALQSVNLFQALQVELEERKRARDALEKSNQYLNSLQTTSLGLVSRLDVNELLRDIVTRAGDLVGSENGYVYIVDPATNEMEMRVGTGLYDDLVGVRARPGAGLAGQVWETGVPLAIDDYQKWPARLPGERRDLLRGVVGVPLRSGDRTAGVIGLAYTDPERKFGANELDVLGRFAQLAAIALDNAQLHQETASRLDEVVALNSISQALTTQLGVKELSKLIIERLRELMPEANAYLISLYDKRTNRVSIPYSLEGEVVQVVEPFPLGQGVSSYIIQNAKPVFINREAERRVRELGALTVGEPAQSFIGVPVMAGNEVIGMLSVQNVERAGLFDDNDLRLLETIASNLGVALRNAQLFEETRRAQTFLDSVVENLPFMVWVKDAGELRYVSVNKAFEDILGMTRGELLGKNAFDLFKRDEAERYTAQDLELMKGSSLLDVPEELVESRTKGVRILHTQKIPIYGSDGKPAYLLAIAEDITERKKANEERAAFERKLLETQKLESLGVLAGGIAHDFNNLLVSILGNVGLALLDLEPASPAREPVEQIKVAAQRAADLTKQMLAYSGKGRFVMQRLNVNAIIEEMTQLLRVSISKNAMLRMNLTPHLPPIEADATQVRQIVMNLIVNASDAIGARDGIITLNTGTVRVDPRYLSDTFMAPELTAGDYVFIEVADTGVGMDPETQKKIFEPFFTTKFTGRGLGLAAVLGIVRGHKGAIKVSSDPGKGTTFRILLPSSEGSSAMEEGAKVNQIERGQGIVLVVDDEDVVRNVTKRMLERFGYGVMMASDGREGVDVYKNSMDKIALVLLDMTMPHMNGEETFRELRVIRPEVKVLLMSGYTEQEATSRFAGKGLAGFLQKPYTPQELHEKIQSILK